MKTILPPLFALCAFAQSAFGQTENVIQVGKPWVLQFDQVEAMGTKVFVNGIQATNVMPSGLVIVSTNGVTKLVSFQVRNLPPVTEKGWHSVTALNFDALGETDLSAPLAVRAKPNAPFLTKAFPQ